MGNTGNPEVTTRKVSARLLGTGNKREETELLKKSLKRRSLESTATVGRTRTGVVNRKLEIALLCIPVSL